MKLCLKCNDVAIGVMIWTTKNKPVYNVQQSLCLGDVRAIMAHPNSFWKRSFKRFDQTYVWEFEKV